MKHLISILTATLLITPYTQVYASSSIKQAPAPGLSELARPLSKVEFNILFERHLSALKNHCQSFEDFPAQIKPKLNAACTLIPAWNHFKDLTTALNDKEKSGVQFSETIKTSKVEQLFAGAWRGSIVGDQYGRPATEFAAELILTKVIIQKSLTAYADFTVFITNGENNSANTYEIPRLIQSIEGGSIIGGLIARYKSQNCASAPNGNTDRCQFEKMRLAAVVNDLYSVKSKEFDNVFRITSLLADEQNSLAQRQMAKVEPLLTSLNKLKNSVDQANELWTALQSNTSKWKNEFAQDFKALSRIPVSLKNEDQLIAQHSLATLLVGKEFQELSNEITVLSNQAKQSSPELLSEQKYKDFQKSSNREISSFVSSLTYFVEAEERSLFN